MKSVPVAQLYESPKNTHRPLLGGVSIGVNASEAGTLGGILTDGQNSYFGVTCAHVVGSVVVVEQPAQIDKMGTVIGNVVEKQLPAPFSIARSKG